jgi:hypothetical protein
MSTGTACDGHGPAGAELRLLLLALLDRFEPGVRSVLAGLRAEAAAGAPESAGMRPSPDLGATTSHRPAGDERAGRAAACQWCPVCSVIALLRGGYPEVGGRLAEGVQTLLDALRVALDDHQPSPSAAAQARAGGGADATAPSAAGAAQPAAASPAADVAPAPASSSDTGEPASPAVQRIEVRRDTAGGGEYPAGNGC